MTGRGAEADRLAGEYQVKAAYLFNFAKFVEWPAEAFASPDAPVVIGIYGPDPFGAALESLVRDKKLAGRPLAIRRSSAMGDLRASHLVFVNAPSADTLPALLAQLAGASVLTVGEHERFIESGGVVRFELNDGRVGFTIDVGAASRSRLTISSQLLRLARATGRAPR
ncbi:MAG: YfiR family protein [Vicinamibacterales bacterium]